MNAVAKALPRLLRRVGYRELKSSYEEQTKKYLTALNELLYELEFRRVPWDVALRLEISQQIARIDSQLKEALRRLP